VVIDSSTPSLIIPKKVNTIQFTDFEVPFYVENINDESIRISSNFPSWIAITSLNNNEFLLSGRPEGNILGEYIFKLSASTFAGLTDSTDITVNVERNIHSSVVQQKQDLNTWAKTWIGSAYLLDNGWVYHLHLGWLYVQPDQFNGAWIWSQKWDWLWTNDQYWDGVKGNLFSKNLNQWIFVRIDEKEDQSLIYNYEAAKWYPF
jgi:hypothetical protein